MIDIGIADQVAIVTGANAGIGAEIAKVIAEQGASVIIHYLDQSTLKAEKGKTFEHTDFGKEKALEIKRGIENKGGKAEIFGGDLVIDKTIPGVFDFAEKAFGPVSILINNAAHCELPDTWLSTTKAAIDRHFAINSRSAVLLIRELAQRCIDKQLSSGRIVNISTDGAHCFPGQISYGASKAALESYTKSLAVELGPQQITVNCIAPGPVQTGWIDEELKKQVLPSIPLGRIGYPTDIANAVLFLVAAQSSWITGQVLMVSGGHNI